MALAIDSQQASSTGFTSAGSPVTSPKTFSFTNTAGTLLYLFVGVGSSSGQTVTLGAMSYNSVAMTKVLEVTTSGGATGGKLGLYRLSSPATGSNTVSLAWSKTGSEANEVWAGCISFTGENATPEAQTHSAQGSGTTASDSLSGVAAGNITICCAGAGSPMNAETQTLSFAANVDDHTSLGNGRMSRSTSTGSVTHAFTVTVSDSWATIIAEVAAAGGAPAPNSGFFRAVLMRPWDAVDGFRRRTSGLLVPDHGLAVA